MIIYSDIDGTLISSQFQVTKKTKNAVRLALSQGHFFVPVSARMPDAIVPIIDSIGIKTPIISYNGALIQLDDGKEIFSQPMTCQTAKSVCQKLESLSLEVVWNAYSGHSWYTQDKKNSWVRREEEIVMVKAKPLGIDELSELPFVHKLLLMGDPEKITRLEVELVKAFPNLSIVKSAPYFIEIMKSGIKKSQAVKYLSEYFEVAMTDTIAFGDNFNDLDMLETVGQGYVMGNAPQEIKDKIGQVTDDNDHDGIAEVLINLLEK